MGLIKSIIDDYENLIKTKITIPLDNGDIIRFEFKPQDLPHLLGLQHLVDNPILFEYNEKRLSATSLYKGMCDGSIDIKEFENSNYFEELYENRIKYFSTSMILDIISARQIVKFNPAMIKVFDTKLEKLDYMFWKIIKDENNNYGYFGIGFMATGNKGDKNYPNTFFFRSDNQYIYNQKQVIPMSLMIEDKHKMISLKFYWKEIRDTMVKNPHYKYLINNSKEIFDEDGNIINGKIDNEENIEIKKHYRLLQIDEIAKAYYPYLGECFQWTNEEKYYILSIIKGRGSAILPHELKILINEHRQKAMRDKS